jgi:general secretion pathway protein N
VSRLIGGCILAALIFCAGAAIAQQPPKRVPGGAPAPAPAAAPAATPASNDDLPALDELTATRERPLFSSTRRPPEVEPPPQAAAPITEATSMPFELVGIVLGSDVSAAIFRNTESKEETRVGKGEKIGNWNVEEISERAVVLHGGDTRVRMRLFNEAKTPGVKVGRIGESSEPDETEASDSEEQVDEDISPSNSPQVRPATAQPKPPPSLQNKGQRPRRPNRGLPRRRQEP